MGAQHPHVSSKDTLLGNPFRGSGRVGKGYFHPAPLVILRHTLDHTAVRFVSPEEAQGAIPAARLGTPNQIRSPWTKGGTHPLCWAGSPLTRDCRLATRRAPILGVVPALLPGDPGDDD